MVLTFTLAVDKHSVSDVGLIFAMATWYNKRKYVPQLILSLTRERSIVHNYKRHYSLLIEVGPS